MKQGIEKTNMIKNTTATAMKRSEYDVQALFSAPEFLSLSRRWFLLYFIHLPSSPYYGPIALDAHNSGVKLSTLVISLFFCM